MKFFFSRVLSLGIFKQSIKGSFFNFRIYCSKEFKGDLETVSKCLKCSCSKSNSEFAKLSCLRNFNQ